MHFNNPLSDEGKQHRFNGVRRPAGILVVLQANFIGDKPADIDVFKQLEFLVTA